MNLSFAGCGFLGVYHLGVAKCLVDHAPNFLRSIKAFAGASAGSLAAAMLATSAPIDKCSDYVVDLTNEARKNPLGPFSRQFDLVGNLRKGMEEYLPSDCHKIASGRLFISVTSLKNRKNYVISEYESKDELMKVLLASCYIPFYVGLDFPEFKGQKWADGGLTNNLPVLPFGETILISPFSGNDLHISPEDESQGLTDITFRNMNIYVNRENLQRELRMFIPPKKEGIEEIVQKGYDDALKFLHKKNLCDHSLLKWFDGGFTDNLPTPPKGDTILISPFSGNSHICPQDASRPLSEFYWRKMHVLVNKENAKRGLNVLYPPKIDGVDKLFSTGFDDAMRFLKTNGFIG